MARRDLKLGVDSTRDSDGAQKQGLRGAELPNRKSNRGSLDSPDGERRFWRDPAAFKRLKRRSLLSLTLRSTYHPFPPNSVSPTSATGAHSKKNLLSQPVNSVNMAEHHGVLVEVIVGGHPQPLFRDPDSEENQKELEKTSYMEAINDARFVVKVTLTNRFQMKGEGVEVTLILDGRPTLVVFLAEKRWRTNREDSYTFQCCSVYDKKDCEWKSADFCFGSLTLLESGNGGEKPTNLGDLGTIHVTVGRVTKRPYHGPQPQFVGFESVTTVSEKAMKGKAIGNTVKSIAMDRINPPRKTHTCTPLPGSNGFLINTRILYRSRRTLQMLECILRSPSPDPVEEVAALRARLALLERNLKIKPEQQAPLAGSATTPTSSTVRVKREHDDDLEVISTKRPRRSGDIEVVDLTDD
ncbi:hypothetical protein MMC30_005568 [Trapelia coarctata]|nr:hypothetical protein [Trapelia coarctata]